MGLGGLVGQGQGSLLEALFGAHSLKAGTITVAGKALEQPTPRRAIHAGIAYVPQERKSEGLLLDKSVAVNMTLAILRQMRALLGIINRKAEAAFIQEAIARAQIRTPSGADPGRPSERRQSTESAA